MAHVAGKSGSVSFTGLTAGVNSWSLEYSSDALETTDFGDSGNRTYISGLSGWTARCSCVFDTVNTVKPGDTGTLTLTVTTGYSYSGSAIVTRMSPTVGVGDVVTVEIEFQGSGPLTITRP